MQTSFKSKGIFLSAVKYSDSSLITNFYTDTHGKIAFLVQGLKNKKSALKKNYLQPLFIMDLDIVVKEKRELQRIKDMKPERFYQSIPFDIKKNTITVFLAEVLLRTLNESEENRELFDFITNELMIFDQSEEKFQDFHLAFLLKYMKYNGIIPDEKDEVLQVLSGIEYLFETEKEKGFYVKTMKNITDKKINFTKKERQKFLEKIIHYYRQYFDTLTNLKTLPVLTEVFN